MAASDHLHPVQLRMFMTARELHGMHSLDVQQTPESRFGGAWKSMDAMWKTKRKENRANGLDKHIAEHGVHNPVELVSGRDVTGDVIAHGHHRIQAAFDTKPESYLPVVHHSLEQHGHWASNDRPVPGWEDTNRFPELPMKEKGTQFDLSALRPGEEADVPTHVLASHPDIWRDERDPKLGGVGSGMNKRGMDAVVPGHRTNLAEGQFADVDTYFGELAHSIKTHGQQEPVLLARQPDNTYWMAEGNHRVAAALRHDIPSLRVKRGTNLRENARGVDIPSSMSVRGPSDAPVERSKQWEPA